MATKPDEPGKPDVPPADAPADAPGHQKPSPQDGGSGDPPPPPKH